MVSLFFTKQPLIKSKVGGKSKCNEFQIGNLKINQWILRGIADAPARSLRLLESILADIPVKPSKDKKRNWEIKKKIGKRNH